MKNRIIVFAASLLVNAAYLLGMEATPIMRINPQTGVTELAQITQTATGQVSINWVPLPPSANHSQPWTPSLAAIPEVDEEEGPQR